MWIVRLALRRPYTFIVMAMLIPIGGVLTIARTPFDIFPAINIPVISVIWQYTGLSPNEVEGRMVTISERAMTTTVNSIEHIESQSLAGVGLIRVFFQPDANIRRRGGDGDPRADRARRRARAGRALQGRRWRVGSHRADRVAGRPQPIMIGR